MFEYNGIVCSNASIIKFIKLVISISPHKYHIFSKLFCYDQHKFVSINFYFFMQSQTNNFIMLIEISNKQWDNDLCSNYYWDSL